MPVAIVLENKFLSDVTSTIRTVEKFKCQSNRQPPGSSWLQIGVETLQVLVATGTVRMSSPKRLLTGSSKELMPLSAKAIDNLQDPTDCGLRVETLQCLQMQRLSECLLSKGY